MSTNTFHDHYVTCPICQRNNRTTPIKSYIGLFSCPYCQEKLVVCQSGHYVRDPFIWKQMMISSALRRQSRPLARIIRDFIFIKRPFLSDILQVNSICSLSNKPRIQSGLSLATTGN